MLTPRRITETHRLSPHTPAGCKVVVPNRVGCRVLGVSILASRPKR